MKYEERERKELITNMLFTGKINSSTLHVSSLVQCLYENHWFCPSVERLFLSTLDSFKYRFFFVFSFLTAVKHARNEILLLFNWFQLTRFILNENVSFSFSFKLQVRFFFLLIVEKKVVAFDWLTRIKKKPVKQFTVYIKNGIKMYRIE